MPALAASDILIGSTRLRTLPREGYGLVLLGAVDGPDAPSAYLDAILADDASREAFFALVDAQGVVVARNLAVDPAPYRLVRGRRTHGRMSQGEYFHHDGCSAPTKPRVVEIRCPVQPHVRTMGTTVAAFPQVVQTMLAVLPHTLRRIGGLERLHDIAVDEALPDQDWEQVQGLLNRTIRQLNAENARAYFQDVDQAALCFHEPWTLGESRFMANGHGTASAQHRRACAVPWVPTTPNGHLIKRWPAEELPGAPVPATDPCEVCARSA